MIRATIFLTGRVQGVGLRHTTREVARQHAVSGTVENLPDRRVKIVVEGEPQEIERFLDSVAARMGGNIHHRERFDSEPSQEFDNFSAIW